MSQSARTEYMQITLPTETKFGGQQLPLLVLLFEINALSESGRNASSPLTLLASQDLLL